MFKFKEKEESILYKSVISIDTIQKERRMEKRHILRMN